LYIGVLILQTARTMYLDANSVEDNEFDLAGFAVNAGLGMVLTYYGLQHGLIRIMALAGVAVFLLLLTININLNTPHLLFSVMLSRYGIVIWFFVGFWAALALHAMRFSILSGSTWFGSLVALSVYAFLVPVAFIVLNYLANRVETESYQQVSSNAIILMCSSFLTVAAAAPAGGSVSNKVATYLLIILSSFLVYAIALMQSTSIVAFWIVMLPIVLASTDGRGSRILRYAMISAVVVALYWLSIAFFLGELLRETRFEALNDGILELSSVQSRLTLLAGFNDQRLVSPIFGAFNAELRAGYSAGNYMHSIPLSLITHTGFVGLLVMAAVCFHLYRSSRKDGDDLPGYGQIRFRMFLGIILLGTLFTFFTWMPFWFFVGVLCVKMSGMANEGEAR
jgi:hypothetical protein